VGRAASLNFRQNVIHVTDPEEPILCYPRRDALDSLSWVFNDEPCEPYNISVRGVTRDPSDVRDERVEECLILATLGVTLQTGFS